MVFRQNFRKALSQAQGVFKVGDKIHFLVQFIEQLLLALKFYFKAELILKTFNLPRNKLTGLIVNVQ
jgi:hypothetical protein